MTSASKASGIQATEDEFSLLGTPAVAGASVSGDPRAAGALSGRAPPRGRLHAAMRRAGWLAFGFFLVKGLVYLAASYVLFLTAIDF